ncbi:MAG: hypothetical protein LBT46_09825 [Planctomycetaceae bacterium]|jgi:hypothetical protein|nr:hypothetical protein [Planctomycetaceae bacterium]
MTINRLWNKSNEQTKKIVPLGYLLRRLCTERCYKREVLHGIIGDITVRLIVLFALGSICLLSPLSQADVNDDALAIEQQAVDNRLNIKSWYAVIDSDVKGFTPDDERFTEAVKYTYYAEGKKRRRDMVQNRPNPLVVAGKVTTKEIWSDYYYSYCDEIWTAPVSNTERVMPLMVRELTKLDGSEVPPQDVRLIGFVPLGFIFDKNVTDILTNTDVTIFGCGPAVSRRNVTEEELDGILCKKIVWQQSKSRSLTTWIAPSRGFSPICMEFRDTTEEVLCRTKVQTEKYKDTDIWFPVSSVFEEYWAGKTTLRETLNITVHLLNEKLDDSIFTAGGLDLPTGFPVAYLDKGEDNYVWNGREIVTEREVAYGHLLKPKPIIGTVRIIAMVLGLLIVASACFRYFFTKPNEEETDKERD